MEETVNRTTLTSRLLPSVARRAPAAHRLNRTTLCMLLLLLLGREIAPRDLSAQERLSDETNIESEPGAEPSIGWGLTMRTLGGVQFWSDELIYQGWRIQRHVLTEHCRLLDSHNYRHASGTYDECWQRFESLKQELAIPPLRGRVVIALHGTGRTRNSMAAMCEFLAENGYTPINVSYASTRNRIENHAASLSRVIENLGPYVSEINFVAHSMGNLIIRHYLADHTDPARNIRPDPRIRRIVMLGPPNNGTQMAARVKDNKLFQMLWGVSGVQMASEWNQLAPHLATPECEFGVIAGGSGEDSGRNPLVEGDDDMVVSVAETRLVGATDFLVLPALHSFLMSDQTACVCTLRFLRHGYFISAAKRQPILAPELSPTHLPVTETRSRTHP